MGLNLTTNTTMAGRITAADANYPYGSSKDETSAGSGDGTPYFKARADDIFGLQQALLRAGGIVPTGNADTALASQYLQAIVELASGRANTYDDSGVADAYVFDVRANQQAPNGLFDGLVVKATISNTNTGASTLNAFGSGVLDIKRIGGVADTEAGDLVAGDEAELTYRSSPSPHFEIKPKDAPVGSVIMVDGDVVPYGYVKENGAELSRTAFPRLWERAQTLANFVTQATKNGAPTAYMGYYGDGDGSTTFTIPDYRGHFIRAWDDGRGIDSGRGIGSYQEASGARNIVGNVGSKLAIQTVNGDGTYLTGVSGDGFVTTSQGGAVAPYTADRAKPRNIAVMYCIKY